MSKPISVVSSSTTSLLPYVASEGLNRIPSDVLKLILVLLDPISFNMAQRSCKALRSASRSMKEYPVQFKSSYGFCLEAAKQGHLGILKWFDKMQAQQNKTGKAGDKETCSVAAERGHLEVLQWARQNGCPWNEETCALAAENGHLSVLQWARQNGCPWDETACAYAALNGHLHVLQWARQNGCPWNELTCAYAALNGHLQILQWARQNGCPWDKDECLSLAKSNNHLHVVQWIEVNDSPSSSPSSRPL